MSSIVKQCCINGFYICLEIRFDGNASYYNVAVYIKQYNNICGYPINKMSYPMHEKEKAYRTYNRYVKKYSGT